MRVQRLLEFCIIAPVLLLLAAPAYAHHEAIFGPQSSAVLSAGRFASAQVFTRDTGADADRRRQTTMVFSAGMQPFKRPLSVAFVMPVSYIGGSGTTAGRAGIEDALISARYRLESERFSDALRLDEASFMAVGGLEIPTGTIDHDFGQGAVGGIVAGLMSVERRPFSLIGYGYYHHTGVYKGARESGNVFFGTGGAWTPIDNLQTGRLVSLQAGLSHERTFAQEQNGRPLANSGGSGLFLHEGLVVGVNEHVQLFALLSLPVSQNWRAPEDRQRFRFGAGTIFVFGH